MTLNRGVSGPASRVMPFPTPEPVQQSPQVPIRLPPPVTLVVDPGSSLLLSPFPTRSPVAGAAGPGPRNPEPGRVIIQVAPDAELAASAVQPTILAQVAPNWGAARSLPGGAGYPAPLVTTSGQMTLMPTTASSVTQVVQGGAAPQAPPPVSQVAHLATSVLPTTSGPLALWIAEDIGVAPAQSRGPREDACSSQSVYQNFRRWQHYKPLAQIQLPQTPDTEALACFFIPVLRSLGRLKPTITLEEGLARAMREWQCTTNYERMSYYDMAAKFMEFEAEEETQASMMQGSYGEPGLQSPTTPMPELQGAPLPAEGQQPVCVPRNAGSQAVAARPQIGTDQQLPRTQSPLEIPPEAVEEYITIMDELLKGRAVEEASMEQEEEARPWSNSNVLDYLDELCSQENFVTQAEAIIQPRFLDHLLSSDPQLDISALAEELEEVEGLSPSQLADEHTQALPEEQTGNGHLRHQVAPKDSSAEAVAAEHGALSPSQAHRRGASTGPCVPTSRSGHTSRPIPPEASLVALPTLESRADHVLGRDPPGSTEGSSEDKALSSLASLRASQQSPEPCGVPLSPTPALSPPSTRRPASPRRHLPSRRAKQTSGPNSASSLRLHVGRGQGSGPTEQTPTPEGPPRMRGVYTVTFVPDSPTLSPKKRTLSSSPAPATGPCGPRRREGLRPRPPQRRACQLPGPSAAPSKKRRVCAGSESSPAEQTPGSAKTTIKYRGVTVHLDGHHTLPLDRLQPVVVLRRIKIPGIP